MRNSSSPAYAKGIFVVNWTRSINKYWSHTEETSERLLREANEQDNRINFAAVLFLPEHEPLRKRLCSLCAQNPLALHRLWKLSCDYGSPAAMRAAIAGHQSRVEWQVFRIYRARNQLVHAGQIPTYLDSLVMNLAEYYRSAIFALVGRASRQDGESDIDQVVAEVGIDYQIFQAAFAKSRKEANFTRDDMFRLI